MAKACINHNDTAAVAQCFQCHRPICSACIIDTPHGRFCSTECSVRYLDFKQRYASEKKPTGSPMVRKLVTTAVIVLALLIGIYVLHAVVGIEALAKVDIIGRIFGTKPKELVKESLKKADQAVDDAKKAIEKK
jgi:hypothetical protein